MSRIEEERKVLLVERGQVGAVISSHIEDGWRVESSADRDANTVRLVLVKQHDPDSPAVVNGPGPKK